MTREEEIHKKAESVTNRFSYRNGYSTPKDAFIEGARWADNNQINPWHYVSEELPKDRTFLVTNSVKDVPDVCYYQKNMDRWIVTAVFSVVFTLSDLRKRYTHWMEIPELPKEEEK